MSTPSEFELDLDLHFLPAWARQPSTVNRYAKFEGEPEGEHRKERGDLFERRAPRRERPWEGRRPERPPRQGDRPEGGRPFRRPERHEEPGREKEADRLPPPPPPEVELTILPEDKGVESLAKHLKLTGRAYPLFEVATLVLKRADRYCVRFSVRKGPEGRPLQPLFVCSLDDSLWLSEDEVVVHVLRHNFGIFYRSEKIPTEPPKGTYTFVAQCGMSGTILGPPNYHDYQAKLRKLHAERFSRMPFEVFKSRVRIVKDEAVVKQWIDEQSWRTEYVCLNQPEEVKFQSREEVEQHFRSVHLPNLVKQVETFTFRESGKARHMSPALFGYVRQTLEEQRRFPIQVARVLSQMFAQHGLQFFKVNKTVTHVCVARPRYLNLHTTSVSENVKRIVEFIDADPQCTRRSLLESLAPSPPPPPPPPASAEPPPAPETVGAEAPEAKPPPANVPPEPTHEQTALITDLHWLIHQGHVIEFADGHMETAKEPKPKPPPPPRRVEQPPRPKPAPAPPAEVEVTGVADTLAAPAGEVPAPEPPAPEPPAPGDKVAVVPAALPESVPDASTEAESPMTPPPEAPEPPPGEPVAETEPRPPAA